MFYNLRYMSCVAAIVITFLTIIAGLYLRHYVLDSVMRPIGQARAEAAATLYVNNIWNRYYPVIAFLSDKNGQTRDSLPQYIAYSQETERFFNEPGLLGATIVYKNGNPLFQKAQATVQETKGWSDVLLGGNVTYALQKDVAEGQVASGILSNAMVIAGQNHSNTTILRVMVPITPTQTTPEYQNAKQLANGILVLDYDIQDYVNTIWLLELMLVLSIAISFTGITAVIFQVTRKAEMVMEKQQETVVEMTNAKATAEAEARNKSKFISNASHELRTPLNAIIGFSEMINSESFGPIENPKYKEFIQDIHLSGQHLLGLVNDILDYSKAEENKLAVDHEEVDLTKLVDLGLHMVIPRAQESKVSLVQEVPSEHIVVMGDQKRLKQVLLNMLSNSVKFTPEGGEVKVKLYTDSAHNRAVMEIRDNGIGMEPQDLARVLTPFNQVESKLSKRYDGTGLGLALTKRLVELMQGHFEIKSEKGLGTTVIISIPLVEEEKGGEPVGTATKA